MSEHKHDYYTVSPLNDIILFDLQEAKNLRDAINRAYRSNLNNFKLKPAEVISVDDSEENIDNAFLTIND